MLYEGVGTSSGTYQKMMVVLPFENNVPWVSADLDAAFARELKGVIETKGSGVTMLMPGSPDIPDSFKDPARQAEGDLDNAALAAAGRASGINLVLLAHLVDMRHVTEDRGMFWFAKVAHVARIQMDIAIYHTGTGARLIDRTFFHNIDISEIEGELIDADEMPRGLPLEKALTELAKEMGVAANHVLKHIPWEGYVSSVEGERIVLSAGEICGLKRGSTLKLFNVEDVLVGETGQRFYSIGDEVGRVTVTAVYPDRSEAVVKNSSGPVLPGSVVRAH